VGEPRQDGERPRATRWPELNRRRRELAEAGEVGPLWELVTTAPWSMVNHEDVFRLLLGALEVRARRDPQGFAEECFARMVGMTSYLVYRSHYILGLKVEAHAAQARARGPSDLPRDACEVLLPRILRLQSHLAELLQARASVARRHELTRSKRTGDDRARGPRRREGEAADATASPCACSGAGRRGGPSGGKGRGKREGAGDG
jgi:hypothetical protein